MTQDEKLRLMIQTLDKKKAEDIQLIKIRDLTILSDYFLIANGTSTTQTKSLADELEFQLKQHGVTPARVEGYAGANWIILDYSDIVVHVFYKETRSFYNLEKLWSDGEMIPIEQFLE